MKPMKLMMALTAVGMSMTGLAGDQQGGPASTNGVAQAQPSVLILGVEGKLDYDYLTELNSHGFVVDVGYSKEAPLNWDRLKQFNCLLLTSLPVPEETKPGQWNIWYGPPYRKEFMKLLARYLGEGGGFLVLLNTAGTNFKDGYENFNVYLNQWGAKLTLERLVDLPTETRHPRSRTTFIYTDKIAPSPVSDKVRGIWFPDQAHSGNLNFEIWGQPVDYSSDWTVVIRGSDTCYSEAMKPGFALRDNEHFEAYTRAGKIPSPPLYAIREFKGGRMALTALNEVFHIVGGTTWVHDGVMLGKGIGSRPSDFNVLIENTLHWLAQPSLQSGKLGGRIQDPAVLQHPNLRQSAKDQFPAKIVPEPASAPAQVFRGVVGARTAYSSGKGTVADYADAARRAGLNFVIFLEEFSRMTEDKYKRLEADCKACTNDVLMIPGYAIDNNIGNRMFLYGFDGKWPTPSQLDGANKDQLRTQCFDDKGQLTYNDEDAKNLLWHYAGCVGGRNIGYYDFAGSKPGSMPVRNLRLFGILGVMTYRDGKLVEDVTSRYLQFMKDDNPPLVCAVDVVRSPEELEQTVKAGHYLTHVAANSLKDIVGAIPYGHQYGRANVNPSQGPRIRSWATNQRVMTYAGESFVTARYRIRPLAWVTSEEGLKEIKIYNDEKVFRRFLLNGEKEFKRIFEWAYDRQRVLVLEAIDMKGQRAISAGFETWCDGNFNGWCHDRQNGELWHGPFIVAGPRQPTFSQGPTWDGGGSENFIGATVQVFPGMRNKAKEMEGITRYGGVGMEGDTFATCFDDSVANIAGFAENIYAPGLVLNAYHTLGPILPSRLITVSLRRTQYVQRSAGPNRDWHAMYAEREGGNMAMMEGSMTFRKDTEVDALDIGSLNLQSFPRDSANMPIFAIRTDSTNRAFCGTHDNFCWMHGIYKGMGCSEQWGFTLQPGGYVAIFATQQGNASMLFNLDEKPLYFDPRNVLFFALPLTGPVKAGDTVAWKYLMIYDSMKQVARNLHRVESIWEYYGLDGKHDSGLKVKRGKLLRHFGLVDLEPENGVVEFEVPAPSFELDIPLGLRFIGFNPNWAIGQLQVEGYSPGFYTPGKQVYRNLAADDRAMVHLAVYTQGVPKTHCVVGHPVQCDAKDLIIEFTHLSDQPQQYHVAVNNPTDAPIKTTLKKCMDLPGFEFPDTPVEVPAGGYVIVKEK